MSKKLASQAVDSLLQQLRAPSSTPSLHGTAGNAKVDKKKKKSKTNLKDRLPKTKTGLKKLKHELRYGHSQRRAREEQEAKENPLDKLRSQQEKEEALLAKNIEYFKVSARVSKKELELRKKIMAMRKRKQDAAEGKAGKQPVDADESDGDSDYMLRTALTPSSSVFRDHAMTRAGTALAWIQSSGLHTSRLNPAARRIVLPGSGVSIKTSRLSANHLPSQGHATTLLTSPRSAKIVLPTATSLVARHSHSSTAYATAATNDDNKEAEGKSPKKACCSSKKDTSASTLSSASSSSSCHTKGHHATTTVKPPTASLAFWSDLSSWQVASVNTFRCLVGCTLGDFGMLFYLQSHHPSMAPTVAMGLAMASGITSSLTLETVLLRYSRKTNLTWPQAFKTAMGMSMISMLTMEAVENAVDFHLMGWNNVDFSNPAFWQAMGLSAFAGWLTPLPWNYWNFKKRGRSCH
ncbi:hypothetical protein BGZ73_003101 [Actinomortierella ambigua]|nr:hypothetical protein BGZ73_003101 [Actinomortierella ambigua]